MSAVSPLCRHYVWPQAINYERGGRFKPTPIYKRKTLFEGTDMIKDNEHHREIDMIVPESKSSSSNADIGEGATPEFPSKGGHSFFDSQYPWRDIRNHLPSTTGLDLLKAAAICAETPPKVQCTDSATTTTTTKSKQLERKKESSNHPRVYISHILDTDVLCGRGGRSNHHPGNKRYRQVVSDMKATYKNTDKKMKKTTLSWSIVDHVCNYGGRFIKKDSVTGKYYLATRKEAQRKTSQALREHKDVKWMI